MPTAVVKHPRPAHPWLAEFERDPKASFDRIIRGVELIGPYGLADPITVIPTLFGPLSQTDPLLGCLDETTRSWLERSRRLPHAERERRGLKRYVRGIVDALALVQLLPLSRTRDMLREKYFPYLRWVSSLVVSHADDARARLWLALAEEQTDPQFRSLWYRLCRQTGEGLYSSHYLSIGLLGLRRLPSSAETETLEHVIGGLAAWATGLSDTPANQELFLGEWRALQWLYTQPGMRRWQELAQPVVTAHRNRPFAAWWMGALRLTSGYAARPGRLSEPLVSDVEALIGELSQRPATEMRTEIERLIHVRRTWAEATGDASRLVLTAGNIAGRIIDDAPDLAADIVTDALEWEPGNEILWNLWGRALAALGQSDLAEAVFWEARRRFPDDERSHVELGRILAASGKFDEAEAILREACDRFPSSAASHVELAFVLAYRCKENLDPAIQVLTRFVNEMSVPNLIALTSLGRFVVNDGRLDAARPILERLRLIDAKRGIAELSALLDRAAAGERPPFPSAEAHYYRLMPAMGNEDAQADGHEALYRDARVSRADFGLDPEVALYVADSRKQAMRDDLRSLLHEEQDNAYARLVFFDRVAVSNEEQARLLAGFSRNYELQLMRAMRHRDADGMRLLIGDEPDRAEITRLALIAFDAASEEDIACTVAWLFDKEPPKDDIATNYAYRALRNALNAHGVDVRDQDSVCTAIPDLRDKLVSVARNCTRLVTILPYAA